MKKMVASLLLTGILALTAAGCGGSPAPAPGGGGAGGTQAEGQITASGSTALLPLVNAAKEIYEQNNEKATINVSGGGSFSGLSQVASGAVQIGNSDVEATGDTAKDLIDHKVAVAPFIIIANKDVTAENVTMDQLARIFKGEITNWKDAGGKDSKITVVSRPQSSGSRATIVAKVLKGQGDIFKEALVQDSNGKVVETVTSTPGAIGYVDAPYFSADKMKALKVDGIEYSTENVINGKWVIYAYEHMYTRGEATGLTKAFLEFILSKDFQETTASQMGFIPATKMTK